MRQGGQAAAVARLALHTQADSNPGRTGGLTDSEDIFIKSSGLGVPTSSMISFN